MEEVLEVDQRPDDPRHPTVGMDETSKPLVGEVVQPLRLQVGHPVGYDYQ
jgi:hypothetical protein